MKELAFLKAIDLTPRSLSTGEVDPSFPVPPRPGPELETFLQNANIPNCKSVRRAIFHQPGLLYYVNDIAFVYYKLLDRNVDYLRELLESDHCLRFLTLFHLFNTNYKFGQAIIAYADLAGPKRFLKQLTPSGDEPFLMVELLGNCLMYATMELWRAQRVFSSPERFENLSFDDLDLSVPITIYPEVPDALIDRYTFQQIRTVSELRYVGRVLHNCLQYGIPSRPVWAIYELMDNGHEELIGAFQIGRRPQKGKYVLIQAHAAHNSKLPRDCVDTFHMFLDVHVPGWRRQEGEYFEGGNLRRQIRELAEALENDEYPEFRGHILDQNDF